MNCKKCGSTEIKSRRTYSHGKKSRPTTVLMCKKCGSTDIETQSFNRRGNFRRR